MASSPTSIQGEFLNTLRKEHTRVNVFLVNGIKLTGHIQSFDTYMVYLNSTNGSQTLFKHAISTIIVDQAQAGRPNGRTTGAPRRPGERPVR